MLENKTEEKPSWGCTVVAIVFFVGIFGFAIYEDGLRFVTQGLAILLAGAVNLGMARFPTWWLTARRRARAIAIVACLAVVAAIAIKLRMFPDKPSRSKAPTVKDERWRQLLKK